MWLDENRLIVYNGDLTGRVISVDADKWSNEELREVVSSGALLLNILFDQEFVRTLIDYAKGSVYVVQEACRIACTKAGVFQTRDTKLSVGDGIDVSELVEEIVNHQSGRYSTFMSLFAGGFQDTQLQMYKWLLHPLLNADSAKLQEGFKYNELRRYLQEKHPQGKALNPGNLTQALQYCASLQVAKNIKPIVLDYDSTALRLNIVDRGFIMWLEYQDRAELYESVGFEEGE